MDRRDRDGEYSCKGPERQARMEALIGVKTEANSFTWKFELCQAMVYNNRNTAEKKKNHTEKHAKQPVFTDIRVYSFYSHSVL